MSTNCLFRRYVIDIRPRNSQPTSIFRSAARARTVLVDGVRIVGESRVAKIQCSGRCDGVTEALFKSIPVRQWKYFRGTVELKLTAVLVGQTQSNMSAPKATETSRSSG